jgi:hypothetical protein
MKISSLLLLASAIAMAACKPNQVVSDPLSLTTPGNPYLPLWEHIPDGEPYVFEDPDNPGHFRVYIYGSHDSMKSGYCGREQVVWSAAIDSLTAWRYDGEIFSVCQGADGSPLDAEGRCDVLYAPDVALRIASSTPSSTPSSTKTYYLYPNNQGGGRNTMVCRSTRPDGPFEVCNWSPHNPAATEGVLGFDPAVFVDDDGRAYAYWGFERSYAAELDTATMASVKPGTQIVEDMISGRYQPGPFRFFEASSIRKIQDKYVFIYSRFTEDGEFGLPTSNYTLAYAYADSPLGPFTYGGTIIDARARGVDEQGNTIATAYVDGNTHGSICEIGGQWYVFYHRQTGTDEYARQAMVAPIDVMVEKGAGGKVEISEGEYTSEGFALEGLNPLEPHPAAIACWLTGPKPMEHEWPNYRHYGSYIAASYGTDDRFAAPYDLRNNVNPVVNNTSGSIVGYKYFNFDKTNRRDLTLDITLTPEGVDGSIRIMADSPWYSRGGICLGTLQLQASMPQTSTQLSVPLSTASLTGKHAIFFVFEVAEEARSLCTLHSFVFEVPMSGR